MRFPLSAEEAKLECEKLEARISKLTPEERKLLACYRWAWSSLRAGVRPSVVARGAAKLFPHIQNGQDN